MHCHTKGTKTGAKTGTKIKNWKGPKLVNIQLTEEKKNFDVALVKGGRLVYCY